MYLNIAVLFFCCFNKQSSIVIYDFLFQLAQRYMHAAKADNPPHIYGVADQAYQSMMHNQHNQVMELFEYTRKPEWNNLTFLE